MLAGAKISAFTTAVNNLMQLLERLEGEARRHLDQGWITVLRQRDEHGLAGDVAPKFAIVQQGDGNCPVTAFEELGEPVIRTRVLDPAWMFARAQTARIQDFQGRWQAAMAVRHMSDSG